MPQSPSPPARTSEPSSAHGRSVAERHARASQGRGIVVWLTGRPSSGKTTLALTAQRELRARGRGCVVLDGDAVRSAIVPGHGYDERGRDAFYATLARLAALVAEQGHVVLVPATANLARYRERARGCAEQFLEVFVATDPCVCAQRDAKGLYAAVRGGAASGLPGVDAIYEAPVNPDVTARGGHDPAAVARIVELVTGSRS